MSPASTDVANMETATIQKGRLRPPRNQSTVGPGLAGSEKAIAEDRKVDANNNGPIKQSHVKSVDLVAVLAATGDRRKHERTIPVGSGDMGVGTDVSAS